MKALLASFLFIFLAEMGDKTQLLAMSLAAKHKIRDVLIAIFAATLINQSLAVFAGHFLITVLPLKPIMLVASISFIVFGFWMLRDEPADAKDKNFSKLGPIMTIAATFFLAELGDKTQIATISLAIRYQHLTAVLAGTTLAMLAANAVGIVAGVVMHKHLPEKTIKWCSAALFILFGIYSGYRVLIQQPVM